MSKTLFMILSIKETILWHSFAWYDIMRVSQGVWQCLWYCCWRGLPQTPEVPSSNLAVVNDFLVNCIKKMLHDVICDPFQLGHVPKDNPKFLNNRQQFNLTQSKQQLEQNGIKGLDFSSVVPCPVLAMLFSFWGWSRLQNIAHFGRSAASRCRKAIFKTKWVKETKGKI